MLVSNACEVDRTGPRIVGRSRSVEQWSPNALRRFDFSESREQLPGVLCPGLEDHVDDRSKRCWFQFQELARHRYDVRAHRTIVIVVDDAPATHYKPEPGADVVCKRGAQLSDPC